MSAWHKAVTEKLRDCGIFGEVALVGAKVRALLDETRFLDIHFDPTTRSYSYALIDLGLPSPGDKRLFGWDDYPHENIETIRQLESYPHHFQRRRQDGSWTFEISPMRGDIEQEIDLVIGTLSIYLEQLGQRAPCARSATQFLQQRLCLLQIFRVKPFGEPVVDLE